MPIRFPHGPPFRFYKSLISLAVRPRPWGMPLSLTLRSAAGSLLTVPEGLSSPGPGATRDITRTNRQWAVRNPLSAIDPPPLVSNGLGALVGALFAVNIVGTFFGKDQYQPKPKFPYVAAPYACDRDNRSSFSITQPSMTITPVQLDAVRLFLGGAISIKDLGRTDWKRQNDVVREAFCMARLFADCGPRAVFVDGHLSRRVMAEIGPTNIKGAINRRCHDQGLNGRRIFIFDTVSSNNTGNRAATAGKLHFHGAIEMPAGWSAKDMIAILGKVFGVAPELGHRQFHLSGPDWAEHYTHNGVRVTGPLGKLLYGIKNAGPTYRVLGLNEGGKRSRSAPRGRALDNRRATRLAKAVPSNFNSAIVFADNATKAAGQEAFVAWLAAERARLAPSPKAATPQKAQGRQKRAS